MGFLADGPGASAYAYAQRVRKRIDNPEVRAARELAARLRRDSLDVVHLGASESLFVSPSDTDQRMLPAMIHAELGPTITFHSVAGAGYHPRLFCEYVDTITATNQRPLILVGLCVRFGFTAWSHHPLYGYERAVAALSRIDRNRALWRIRRAIPAPTEAEMTALDSRPYRTLAGDLTIGDYRGPLKNPTAAGLSREDAIRLLYAYHYGSVLTPDDPWLDTVTQLGRRLRTAGLPVVAYHLPVPLEAGVEIYGEVFRERAAASVAALNDAFTASYGPLPIVPTALALSSAEFIDPADATEHVNQLGRRHLATMIAAAVTARLQAVTPSAVEGSTP